MNAVTVDRFARRAIIRTNYTWYSVSLEWLKANVRFNELFAEAIEKLEGKRKPSDLIGKVTK